MKNQVCKRCGLEYNEQLASRFDGLCDSCVSAVIKDIMIEWWDGQDPLDQDEMIRDYIKNLQ